MAQSFFNSLLKHISEIIFAICLPIRNKSNIYGLFYLFQHNKQHKRTVPLNWGFFLYIICLPYDAFLLLYIMVSVSII